MIQEQVFDILEDKYSLEFSNLYAYGYQNNSSAFAEMCSIGSLLDDNEALQRRVAERTNTTINPSIKVYDICIMIGRPDDSTFIHMLKCMKMRVFNKLLIVDANANDKENYLSNMIMPEYHHGNGEVIKSRMAAGIRGDMDKEGIARNIAQLYGVIPQDDNDETQDVA